MNYFEKKKAEKKEERKKKAGETLKRIEGSKKFITNKVDKQYANCDQVAHNMDIVVEDMRRLTEAGKSKESPEIQKLGRQYKELENQLKMYTRFLQHAFEPARGAIVKLLVELQMCFDLEWYKVICSVDLDALDNILAERNSNFARVLGEIKAVTSKLELSLQKFFTTKEEYDIFMEDVSATTDIMLASEKNVDIDDIFAKHGIDSTETKQNDETSEADEEFKKQMNNHS